MPQLNSSQVVPYILSKVTASGEVFYCTGPTLSGRTFICEEIERSIKLQSAWQPRTYLHTCKQSDVGHEVVTTALKHFAKADGLTGRKLKRMAAKGWPGLLKAGRAIASHFFPIPSEIDSAIDQLASAFKNDGDERLKAFPQSNVDLLIELLRAAIDDVGSDGILLIVDALEDMPVPGVLLIQALLQASIQGLTVLVTANTEAASTQQSEHTSLKARLQYKSPDTIVEITGHSPAEIVEWKHKCASVQISVQEADAAFSKSNEGRSGLLAPWMKVTDASPTLIERGQAKLYGQLDLEFSGFSKKMQVAVTILAQCYPDPLPLDQLASKINANREDMVTIRDQLVSSFAVDEGSGLRLKRKAVFDYVFQKIGLAALHSNWAGDAAHNNISVDGTGAQKIPSTTNNRLLTIDRDLKRGAVQAAYDRIEVALKVGGDTMSDKPTLLRHLADVHDQRGEYPAALTCLTEAFALTNDAAAKRDFKLLLATVQFRLGETTEALKALHWVRKHAISKESVDASFTAVLRSISVLIERDKTQAAIRIAKSALNQRSKTPPSKTVDCHLIRIAARALVLSQESQGLAKTLALEALSVAQQDLGARAIGNCLYCLGDVYRHRSEHDAAEQAYRDALTHATTNFDLRLYCNLGIAAIAIATADDDLLENSLVELSQLPITVDSPEWIIVALYGRTFVATRNEYPAYINKFLQANDQSPQLRKWQVKLEELLHEHELSSMTEARLRLSLARINIVL